MHRVPRTRGRSARTGLRRCARQPAALRAPARTLRHRRRSGAPAQHRGGALRQHPGRPGRRQPAGRVPDRDQAARQGVCRRALPVRVLDPRQRRRRADPRHGGAAARRRERTPTINIQHYLTWRATVLKNLKIGIRLGLGFGALLLLLLATAVLGIDRMASMNQATVGITTDAYPKVVLAKDLIRDAADVPRQMRGMLLAVDEAEVERYRKQTEKARANIQAGIAELSKVVASESGKKLLKEIVDANAALEPMYAQVYGMVRGERQRAAEYISKQLVPADRALTEAAGALAKHQADKMDALAQQAAKTYDETRQLVIGITAGAALLALLVATLITLSVTRPLRQAVQAADSLAAGDLTVEIKASGRDEAGLLLAAM
ncbi:MAG: HAMP domain-containing protein, partial [Oxalobacteraceae bacterium]